jgi:hypothetical protein
LAARAQPGDRVRRARRGSRTTWRPRRRARCARSRPRSRPTATGSPRS